MIFNKNIVDLIIQMKEKKSVTRKTQTIYNSVLGWFVAMKWLRDHDLINSNGTDRNNFKIWSLNEKGKEIATHLECMRDILKVDEK
jgi:hypothetical protein